MSVAQTEIDYLNLKCASRGHYIELLEALTLLVEVVRLRVESLRVLDSYRGVRVIVLVESLKCS